MHVRKAESKDKEDVLKIADLLSLDIPNFVWNTKEFVEKQIKRGEYFLAEKQGKAAGIISFRQRSNKMCIETLAVSKDFQLEGVGAELIGFAREFTKKRNLKILHAYSFAAYKTVDFYLNQGFSLMDRPGIYNNHKYYRFEMSLE